MTKPKPYKKPQVKKVKLIPQEAVLQGCKAVGGTGPTSPPKCEFKGNPSCQAIGS